MTKSGPDDRYRALGAELRRRRRDLGLTLVQLAEQVQLSHPFLSQLERGLARPSMMTLARLADALDTTQVELMIAADSGTTGVATAGDGTAEARVIRSHDGLQLPRSTASSGSGEGSTRLLVHGRAAFYPQEFTEVHTEFGPYFVHDEDEWVYVVSGAIITDLGDQGQARLAAEDSLYYTGGTPHRWRVVDCASARLIVVKAAGAAQHPVAGTNNPVGHQDSEGPDDKS
ncbi:helix-turn-helix domain-containing protein [Nocardia macrotermitis]|uniref:HTH cro/C1-type domain-containing protein n=1 Tax=Nocardia macrotermitis TaxID=2585198 RepID=A0A7K0D0C0_9NOCA|nr:XRE family transcriptional regulator [Nocardia macrotermitis]MQY18384.1 hypothetical protein [Nocardia macrotermitis]